MSLKMSNFAYDMKKIILILLLIVLGVAPGRALGNAQNPHHAFFEFDFQPDTYTLGIGYHYMFTDFIGLGASIGFLGDANQSNGVLGGIDNIINGEVNPYYDDDTFENAALYFQPSLYLRTPTLRLKENIGLGASLMPWFRINTNHYASDYIYNNGRDIEIAYRCRTFSVGVRVGPTVYIGQMGISLGYTISNMDIMREYNDNGHGFTSKPAQGFSFDLSYSF